MKVCFKYAMEEIEREGREREGDPKDQKLEKILNKKT